jgi:hypothetical protein
MSAIELGAGESTLASLTIAMSSEPAVAAAAPLDPWREVEARINLAVRPGGEPLAITSMELYLIRGLNTVDLGQGPVIVVAFAPEFLYVADVGMRARAGVSVSWVNGIGAGDPTFPDFASSKLRSISDVGAASLIYPAIAGELIVGVVTGTPSAEVVAGLEANGLWDVRITGTMVEARCDPFREVDICAALPGELAFVKYAQLNRVVRLVDISPGWTATRIA